MSKNDVSTTENIRNCLMYQKKQKKTTTTKTKKRNKDTNTAPEFFRNCMAYNLKYLLCFFLFEIISFVKKLITEKRPNNLME